MAQQPEELNESTEAVQDQEEMEAIEEQVDPNEEIFEGGPTNADIEGWKEIYNGNVFFVPFQHRSYIYRTLYRNEYKQIMKIDGATEEYRRERMVAKTLLWPDNYNKMEMDADHAGVVDTLVEYIMATSGFRPESGPIKL